MLRRHGDFYRIAGHRISEIDGFSPATVKPFDEFAMLGPADPDAAAAEIAAARRRAGRDRRRQQHQRRGARHEPGLPASTRAIVREVLLDNPLGQNDELTPIIVVRPAPAS